MALTKERLLELVVDGIQEWPEGTDFLVNSRVCNEVDFYAEGEDFMRTYSGHKQKLEMGIMYDDPYIAITKKEWEEARAIR